MLNSQNTHLIEAIYDRLKSREITFQQYRKILLHGDFDGLQISMNIKILLYLYSLLFTENIQNTTQIFPRFVTIGFFRVSTGALA